MFVSWIIGVYYLGRFVLTAENSLLPRLEI
jgi:hypothetical protein